MATTCFSRYCIALGHWSFDWCFLTVTFNKLLKIPVNSSNLTFSWRRSLSHRNLSIDLLCKSIQWFLYDRNSVMKELPCAEGPWWKFQSLVWSLWFSIKLVFLQFDFSEFQEFSKILNFNSVFLETVMLLVTVLSAHWSLARCHL